MKEVHHLHALSLYTQIQINGEKYTYRHTVLGFKTNCVLVGIWSAALDGDLERVLSFLKKGIDPNMRDQSHYTALVCCVVPHKVL